MKCINCGRTCEHYLCDACATVEVLDKLILQLYYYQPDKCENPHLSEFVSSLPEDCAPEVSSLPFWSSWILQSRSMPIACITSLARMNGMKLRQLRIFRPMTSLNGIAKTCFMD